MLKQSACSKKKPFSFFLFFFVVFNFGFTFKSCLLGHIINELVKTNENCFPIENDIFSRHRAVLYQQTANGWFIWWKKKKKILENFVTDSLYRQTNWMDQAVFMLQMCQKFNRQLHDASNVDDEWNDSNDLCRLVEQLLSLLLPNDTSRCLDDDDDADGVDGTAKDSDDWSDGWQPMVAVPNSHWHRTVKLEACKRAMCFHLNYCCYCCCYYYLSGPMYPMTEILCVLHLNCAPIWWTMEYAISLNVHRHCGPIDWLTVVFEHRPL